MVIENSINSEYRNVKRNIITIMWKYNCFWTL